ncbi:MAG: hypothetical protein HQM08_28085 [Candidatus Riflebacteria bacterium]|nr:hypothetical protein [Candidatus Riflebacteria bacterium]
MFKTKPVCELCGKEEATAFSIVLEDESKASSKGNWKFVCVCVGQKEYYPIPIKNFFDSPASTVDWLAQMHGKPELDGNDFIDMMYRFRKATCSFGKK